MGYTYEQVPLRLESGGIGKGMKEAMTEGRWPVVAIIGRPNVGKSTLFNRLIGERKALVDDEPGVTRDRNYGRMEWRGRNWRIVDTGGLEPQTSDDLLRAMRGQIELAMQEADVLLFLLDGREGLLPADLEVAELLRRQRKPLFFAVNKIDGPLHEPRLAEFYRLGAERIFGISAAHGYGLDDLLDALWEEVPGKKEEEETEDVLPRVAVVGRPNVGKSTLINALLGEDGLLVHPRPGTTRDAVDREIRLGGKKYLFIDTAGLRKKSRINLRLERFSSLRTLKTLERAHLVLLMMDAGEGVVDQEAKIAGLAEDRGRALILLFNKWDLVTDKDARRRELTEQVRIRLPHVSWAPILTISAREGTRLSRLGGLIEEVLEQYSRRVGTGELNRRLAEWTAGHQPPSRGKTPLRFYYAAQISVRPPGFVFFVNRPEKVPAAYERYLANRLREDFGFTGVPLRLHFRARKGRRLS